MSKEQDENLETPVVQQTVDNSPPPIQEEEAQDLFLNIPSSGTSRSPNLNNSGIDTPSTAKFSPDDEDPITKAIREQILLAQRNVLRDYIGQQKPELAAQIARDEQDKQDLKFREFLAQDENKELVAAALKNAQVKAQLENLEVAGYAKIHADFDQSKFPGGFSKMAWNTQVEGNLPNVKAQIVTNDNGDEICTLKESTHRVNALVQKEDGTAVQISNYRTIDFPVKLDESAQGRMHLSIVALDENGKRPPKDKAVYFTAHYEEDPTTGVPKLKEVSHPMPIKFNGPGDDAVGYIEREGKVYSLPVTQGKYKEMMREVAINNEINIDLTKNLSQSVEVSPEVKARFEEQNRAPQMQQQTDSVPPFQSQSPSSRDPSLIDAARGVGQALTDLLNQMNEGLANNPNKIEVIKKTVDGVLNNPFIELDEKKSGVTAITVMALESADLQPAEKVEAVKAIAERVVVNENIAEPDKAEMLGNIAGAVLESSLDNASKLQAIGAVVDQSLKLSPDGANTALENIADAVINSSLDNENKGKIFENIAQQVLNDPDYLKEDKAKMLDNLLKKGAEAGILTPEQQQKMQKDVETLTIDPSREQQTQANVEDRDRQQIDKLRQEVPTLVKGLLNNTAIDDATKAKNIGDITNQITNNNILPIDIKTEIVKDGISNTVANHSIEPEVKALVFEKIGAAIVESAAPITEKVEITKASVNGVGESSAIDADKSKMVDGLIQGIEDGLSLDGSKEALVAAAKEAAKANNISLDQEYSISSPSVELSPKSDRLDEFNKASDKIGFLNEILNDPNNSKEQKKEAIKELVTNNDDYDKKGREDILSKLGEAHTSSVSNAAIIYEARTEVDKQIQASTSVPEMQEVQRHQEQSSPSVVSTQDQSSSQQYQEQSSPSMAEQQPKTVSHSSIDRAEQIRRSLLGSSNFGGGYPPALSVNEKQVKIDEYQKLSNLGAKEAFIETFTKDSNISKSDKASIISSLIEVEEKKKGMSEDAKVIVQDESKQLNVVGSGVDRYQNPEKLENAGKIGQVDTAKIILKLKDAQSQFVTKTPEKHPLGPSM